MEFFNVSVSLTAFRDFLQAFDWLRYLNSSASMDKLSPGSVVVCGDIVLNWRRKIFKIYAFVREGRAKVWDKISPTERVGGGKTVKEVQGALVLHLTRYRGQGYLQVASVCVGTLS